MAFDDQALAEFDDEMNRTRQVLAAIPADRLDWKAAEGLQTIRWNAGHLLEIAGWTAAILGSDEFDFAPVGGPPPEQVKVESIEQLLADYDQAVSQSRAAMAAASDAQLAENWTLKMGGQPLFTMAKGPCVRKWVLNHTIHHRGILSVYLRLMGVDVTPVYDA